MISPEFLNAPIDSEVIRAEVSLDNSKTRICFLGCAVIILDPDNRVLLLEHEADGAGINQGDLGPCMEKFRHVPARGENIGESLQEAWQRQMHEEMGRTVEDINKSKLYISKDCLLEQGTWHLGEDDQGASSIAIGFGMVIRSAEPQHLLMKDRSEEILSNSYVPMHEVLDRDNLRIGFREWYQEILEAYDDTKSASPLLYIDPIQLPKTSRDMWYGQYD